MTAPEHLAIHAERAAELFRGSARYDLVGAFEVEEVCRMVGLADDVRTDEDGQKLPSTFVLLGEEIARSLMGDDPYRANKRFPERNPSAIDPENPEVFPSYPSYVIGRAKMIVLPAMLSKRTDEAALPALVGVEESNAVASWVEQVNPDLAHVRRRKSVPMPKIVDDNGDFHEVPYKLRSHAALFVFNDRLAAMGVFESSEARMERIFGYDNEGLSSQALTQRIRRETEIRREVELKTFKALAERADSLDIYEIGRTVICARATDGPRAHEQYIDFILARIDDSTLPVPSCLGDDPEREQIELLVASVFGYCRPCDAIRYPVGECVKCGAKFEKSHGNMTKCMEHRRKSKPITAPCS
jgi:hypothetical protein